MSKRAEVLHKAEEIICNDRESQYGSPEDSFAMIGGYWSMFLQNLGCDILLTNEQVAEMMALMKLARIQGGRFKADSYIDLIGYMAIAYEQAQREEPHYIGVEE